MLLTRRLLILLLGAAIPILISVIWSPALIIFGVYLAAVVLAAVADWTMTASPSAFNIKRINEDKLSLGAENLIQIQVQNRSVRPARIEVRDEPPYRFPASTTFLSATVPARGSTTLRYHLTPLRRGDYRFGYINVRLIGPLGLIVRQWAVKGSPAAIKVYPNLLEVRKYELLARRNQLAEAGLHAVRILGAGTEFERLRDYQKDDDFRKINWKATARRMKPITMEFETERSQNVMIMLDVGRHMMPPVGPLRKVDYAVNTSLMLGYISALRGDRVGILTFADKVIRYIQPRSGRGQFYTLLDALYNVESYPVEPDYAEAFQYLALRNRRRSLVVVFTDVQDAVSSRSLINYLVQLSPHHLPVCVTMSDPNILRLAEQTPTNSATTYQKAVAQNLLNERREVLEILNRHGAITLDVPADKLTVSVINTYLEIKARQIL